MGWKGHRRCSQPHCFSLLLLLCSITQPVRRRKFKISGLVFIGSSSSQGTVWFAYCSPPRSVYCCWKDLILMNPFSFFLVGSPRSKERANTGSWPASLPVGSALFSVDLTWNKCSRVFDHPFGCRQDTTCHQAEIITLSSSLRVSFFGPELTGLSHYQLFKSSLVIGLSNEILALSKSLL